MQRSECGRESIGLRTAITGLLLYAGVAVALTYPLVLHFGSSVISHWTIDVEHGLWVQYWFARAVESRAVDLFSTQYLHYPSTVDLQFADINLAVTGPYYALSRLIGIVATWNVLVLASFVASAALAWKVAYSRCREPWPAWMAGVFFAASSYWLATMVNAWVYLIHAWVLPLLVLALDHAWRRQRLRDWALLGAASSLAFHVTPYYFLYGMVLLGLLLPWLARRDPSPMKLLPLAVRIGVAGAVAALGIAPRALPMALAASRSTYVAHHGPMNTALAARLPELFWPSRASVEARVPADGYLVVFLGFTFMAVLLLGALFARRRADMAPWLITGGILLVLALGPHARVGGSLVPLPGYLVQKLPVFSMTTNHWRWTLPAMLCLSVAAGLALTEMRVRAARRSPRWAALVVPLVFCLHVAEVFLVFPVPPRKPLYDLRSAPAALRLATMDDVKVVLDLSPAPKLNQITHGKRIVGGWLPRLDVRTARATEDLMRRVDEGGTPQARVQRLGEAGVQAVIWDSRRLLLISADPSHPGTFESREIDVE